MCEKRNITWLETSATAVIEYDESLEEGDTTFETIDGKEYEMEVVETGTYDGVRKCKVEVISIDGLQVSGRTVYEF